MMKMFSVQWQALASHIPNNTWDVWECMGNPTGKVSICKIVQTSRKELAKKEGSKGKCINIGNAFSDYTQLQR